MALDEAGIDSALVRNQDGCSSVIRRARRHALPHLEGHPDGLALMERLRARAAADHLSLNRQAIWLLEQVLEPRCQAAMQLQQKREAQLTAWRALAARWRGTDEETAALVEDIYRSGTQGREVAL